MKVSITGDVEVSFPSSIAANSSKTIYDPQLKKYKTIYNYNNDISTDITATLTSYSNLTKFEIKKIK